MELSLICDASWGLSWDWVRNGDGIRLAWIRWQREQQRLISMLARWTSLALAALLRHRSAIIAVLLLPWPQQDSFIIALQLLLLYYFSSPVFSDLLDVAEHSADCPQETRGCLLITGFQVRAHALEGVRDCPNAPPCGRMRTKLLRMSARHSRKRLHYHLTICPR